MRLVQNAPLRTYTRAIKLLSNVPVPPVWRRPLWRALSTRVGIRLEEADGDLRDYETFGQLFTRPLRQGCRPIDERDDVAVSPVDGVVSAAGQVQGGQLFQVKGNHYSLEGLCGDAALAHSLEGGAFVTLYLRPKDYHRIHCPMSALARQIRRIPGRLLPVQPVFVRHVKNLFASNERLVLRLELDSGPMVMIAVGATAVGAIGCVFKETGSLTRLDPWVPIAKGQELGRFNLGSTVIVVWHPGAVELLPLRPGDELSLGQAIARRCAIAEQRHASVE